MSEDEFLFTAKGSNYFLGFFDRNFNLILSLNMSGVMCISDVKKCIDDLEKKHRITSVESLWKAKRYKEVAKIIFFL